MSRYGKQHGFDSFRAPNDFVMFIHPHVDIYLVSFGWYHSMIFISGQFEFVSW